ncbi:TPA: 4Fe-4S single cluster domain-containing protein, partial [Staphylococcus aureus]
DCDHDYISGLSLLGGEPFCNLDITLNLVKAFRARFGNTKTIWVWTGFLYEYLANDCTERRELLSYIDVLVDGLFIQHLFKPDLPYKGSLNQRIIDVQQSLSNARMIEYIVS